MGTSHKVHTNFIAAPEGGMKRRSVTTDKDRHHQRANLWATETMGNSKYPLKLFLRGVTVGLEIAPNEGD